MKFKLQGETYKVFYIKKNKQLHKMWLPRIAVFEFGLKNFIENVKFPPTQIL